MAAAGMDAARQDEQIQQLNNSLAAASRAKCRGDPRRPAARADGAARDAGGAAARRPDVEIDEAMVLDLSGHQSSRARGRGRRRLGAHAGRCWPGRASCRWAAGTCSTTAAQRTGAAGLARHAAAAVAVRHAGRALRAVPAAAAGGLILQAGLLLPAQDEALTVRATRSGAGQARRRPVAADELRRTPRLGVARRGCAIRPVDQALFGATNSSSRIERIGLAQAPEDHQHDDLQVFQPSRGLARRGHGAVDDHHPRAHRRRQRRPTSRKPMKPIESSPSHSTSRGCTRRLQRAPWSPT